MEKNEKGAYNNTNKQYDKIQIMQQYTNSTSDSNI